MSSAAPQTRESDQSLRVLLVSCYWRRCCAPLMAQEASGEANLKLPRLDSVTFLGGISGSSLLMGGLVVSALGLIFGLADLHAPAQHAGAQTPCAKSAN